MLFVGLGLVFIGILMGAGVLHLAFLAYFHFVAEPVPSPTQPKLSPQAAFPDLQIRVAPTRAKKHIPDVLQKMMIVFAAMVAQIATVVALAFANFGADSVLPGVVGHVAFLFIMTALIAQSARLDFVQSGIVTGFYFGIEILLATSFGVILAIILVVARGGISFDSDNAAENPPLAEAETGSSSTPMPITAVEINVEGAGADYADHAMMVIGSEFDGQSWRGIQEGNKLKITILNVKDAEDIKKRIPIGTVQAYDAATGTVTLAVDPRRDRLSKLIREDEAGRPVPDKETIPTGTRVLVRHGSGFLPGTVESDGGFSLEVRIDGLSEKPPKRVFRSQLRYPRDGTKS